MKEARDMLYLHRYQDWNLHKAPLQRPERTKTKKAGWRKEPVPAASERTVN